MLGRSRHVTDQRSSPWLAAALAGVAVLAFGAAGSDWLGFADASERGPRSEPSLDPGRFSATVDNPLFPVSLLRFKRMRGSERNDETGRLVRMRVETRVLPTPSRVAGVPVTVAEDKDFENGRLVERTLDYFAQDRDGNVWYFGERVDDYEHGRVVGHEGQWLAGRRGAKPGLFMPAHPTVGRRFSQERAPGVAEDRSTVLAVGLRMNTPARTFTGCIKTRDVAPIEGTSEFKYYCPGVGIARQTQPHGGRIDVVSFG
jgi:hypothetical protein